MNELETVREAPVYANLDTQMDAINALGTAIAKSGFAGCEKVEQGIIIAFTCLAEKITPIEFSRTYDIISGKPTKKAAVMLAEFRSQYGGEFEWVDDDNADEIVPSFEEFEYDKETPGVYINVL